MFTLMENKTINQALERLKNDCLQNVVDHLSVPTESMWKCMGHEAQWRQDEYQNQEDLIQ